MIWQTDEWKQLCEKTNQVEKIIKLDGFSIEKRSLGLGKYGLFLLGYYGEISTESQKRLQDLCILENAVFIQLETNNYHEKKLENIFEFQEKYYKKFITPYTAVIDLTQDISEILSKMKPKGRYNIKVSDKKGVDVRIVEKSDNNIKSFYDLMTETTSRDGFSGNSFSYYQEFLRTIKQSELILAYKNDTVIAGGIFVFGKDVTIYYYGASTSQKEFRNCMAPYGVQYLAISEAKNRGSNIYDFLGVATPGDNQSSLLGVTSFKTKLTKDIRFVSQSFIWINKSFSYTMLVCIRKLKKIIKK